MLSSAIAAMTTSAASVDSLATVNRTKPWKPFQGFCYLRAAKELGASLEILRVLRVNCWLSAFPLK
jgi:hypothetical protein